MTKRPSDEELKEIAIHIEATRHWNGGAGLIVPPAVARELRKLGFRDGYTEQSNTKI